ncbi:MAG: hypothetical protein VX589_10565 [Myxococcota bacterium]|nr:hypothetical protein [Myxococcota bacterium]
MRIFFFVSTFVFVLFGCSSDKTIPLDPSTGTASMDGPTLPTGGVIYTPDAIVTVMPDMGTDAAAVDAMAPDAGPLDASISTDAAVIDSDATSDVIVDMGMADDTLDEPEYVFDVEPSEVPEPNAFTIVGGGDFTQLVYWRGGRIFHQRVNTQIDAPAMGTLPNVGEFDPNRVTVELGPMTRLGYRAPTDSGLMDGRLVGVIPTAVSGGQRGWVIVSNGFNERATVIDLSRPEQAPFELGLYGPIRTTGYAVSTNVPDQVLVMGRMEPTADADVGHVVLADGLSPEPVIDMRGYPLPVSMTTAGVHWMMAFDDGICVILEALADGPGDEIGLWRCHSDSGTRLIGRSALGDNPSEIYGVTKTAGGLVAWDLRPGQQVSPVERVDVGSAQADNEAVGGVSTGGSSTGDISMGGTIEAGSLSGGSPVGGAPIGGDRGAGGTHAGGMALALGGASPQGGDGQMGGAPADDVIEEDPDTSAMAGTDDRGVIILGDGSAEIRWLNQIPNGYAMAITEGDNTRYALADSDGVTTVELTSSENLLGIIKVSGGIAYAVRWDGARGQPLIERATLVPTHPVPAADGAVCIGQVRAPERCDAIDHDCDGRPYGDLCCARENTLYRNPRPIADIVTGDWSVFGDPLDGLVGIFPFDDRVEIRTLVSTGASLCLGCFADIESVKATAKLAGFYAILARAAAQNDQRSTCPQACTSVIPLPVDSTEPDQPMMAGDSGGAGESAEIMAGQAAGEMTGGTDGAGGEQGGAATPGGADGGAAAMGMEQPEQDPVVLRDVVLLRFSSGELTALPAPCRDVQAMEITRNGATTTVHLFCADGRFEYTVTGQDDAGQIRNIVDNGGAMMAYEHGTLNWIGPPTRQFEGSDLVTHRLAAFGEAHDLVLYRLDQRGVQEVPLPTPMAAIADGPVDGRMHPIRLPINPLGYIARTIEGRVFEVWIDGRWQVATARRNARRIMFAHWDDLAVTLAPDLDSAADGFQSIYQELIVFTHQLVPPALHWGRQIPESIAKFKAIEFQGITLGDYANPTQDVSQPPLIWWAIGSEGFAPTARTTSLTCYE